MTGNHRIGVTAQRIDLAVVAHKAIRLRAIPRREGIGAEARVHHCQMGLEIRAHEILIKRKQLARRQHTFIDNNLGRQAAGVNLLRLGERGIVTKAMSKALADNIELALELVLAQPLAGTNKQLLDARLGGERCRSDVRRGRVGGYVAPSDQLLTFVGDYLINDLAA